MGRALLAAVQGDAATARGRRRRAREPDAWTAPRGASASTSEAVSAFIAGETARGLALVDEHVAEFPRDAMLVNQASSAIALAGRSDREEHRVAFLERLAPAYGDDWWFQSALAFTYHEVDRFDESRRLSQASLDQYPRNASAAHNLAHIAFETLDIEAGSAFLDDWMAGYDRRATFHCHLAWHQAMFALHEGRYAQALAIFERDILRRGQSALRHDRRHRAALARPPRRRRPARAAVARARRPGRGRLAARLPLRRVPRRAGLRGVRRRGGADAR